MKYLDLDTELEKLGKYKDFPRYLCENLDSTGDDEIEVHSLDLGDKIHKRLYNKNRQRMRRRIPKEIFKQIATSPALRKLKKARLFSRNYGDQIEWRVEVPKMTPGRPEKNLHWWRVVWLLQAFFKKHRRSASWQLIAEILNRYQKSGDKWDEFVLQSKWQRKLKDKKFREFVKTMNAEAFLDDEIRGYEAMLNKEGIGENVEI